MDIHVVVPIHLDALYVSEASPAVPAMADFARLPYFDGVRDVNASVPWLGAEAASECFDDLSLVLEKGIHLHWRLPKGLTTGTQLADGTTAFLPLPDRWLVTRGRYSDAGLAVEKQWVIESDYLHPEGTTGQRSLYPISTRSSASGRSFRYMGRVLPLDAWIRNAAPNRDRTNEEYLDGPLTTIGYGEPSFATFYPNCAGIFGFHDPEYANQIPDGLYYQVIGWSHTPAKDPLRELIARDPQCADGPNVRRPRIGTLFAEQLRWSLSGITPLMPLVVCNGSLIFRPNPNLPWAPELETPKVTFGATITEALSALLADELVPAGSSNAAVVKAEIEDQLEAIMLDPSLNSLVVDLAAKFKEARHRKGFDEVYGGTLWTVRAETGAAPSEDAGTEDTPWPDVGEKLRSLNQLQQAYNRAWDEIHALRRQLYCDWCKYMWCAYSPLDPEIEYPEVKEARFFIEQQSLPELQRKLADAGELLQGPAGSKEPPKASAASVEHSLARQIENELRGLLESLARHETESKDKTHYVAQAAVAPRYYRPTEPVILLTGKITRVDEPVHPEDLDDKGLLKCYSRNDIGDIERTLIAGRPPFLSSFPAKPRVWTEQPWHPFLLEWEVELTPFKELGNLTTSDRNFDEKFITHNFTLKRPDADLSVKDRRVLAENPKELRDSLVYQGSSLLTPHVADQYIAQIYAFVKRLEDQQNDFPFPPIIEGPEEDVKPESAIDRLIGGLMNHRPKGLDDITVNRLLEVLNKLRGKDFFCLAQRLSGFNEALLMQKQTLRIPIDDPIGFDEAREFAHIVGAAVAGDGHSAPQPLKSFVPIRTGEMRVRRLRLISTFGRKLDFDCDHCITAAPMQPRSSDGLPGKARVYLPPRLVQPARMQFRFLAAEVEGEMDAHPDSTPICGWVIANHLDDSLFFYSGEGKVLGSLEAEREQPVRWRPAPHTGEPVLRLEQIENPYLRQLIAFFLSGSAAYFNDFLADLEAAQQRIEPEHSGEPLPMGQPLALVRASLSLELQGPPALHQGWKEFRENMSQPRPDSDKFTNVRFPVRLGEQDQLNDGLTVYWLENEDGSYNDNSYIIPNYDSVASPEDKRCDFLYQSIDSAPLKVTMLVDPRGVVHVATGIQPSKAIQIPQHQYAAALREFEMTFLTAPVLAGKRGATEADAISLPVTDPPGYSWSWLEKRDEAWTSSEITGADLFAPFAGATQIREGWLKLKRKDKQSK